jgi:uncharacterized damage-inducible protein DinB
MSTEIEETWRIHNRIHLFLLKALNDDQLQLGPQAKGRTIGHLLAHIHDVRLMWLKAAAPDLLAPLEKLGPEPKSLSHIGAALEASGERIASLLGRAAGDGGRVKGFKPHATAFLAYLIAHESHHRGQIALILRQNGQPLDKKTSYGMWEWGVR